VPSRNDCTSKVVKTAVNIYKGLEKELKLGTLDSTRDWGHAKDYVRAIWMILQMDKPDDYVCSTGETHSIKDLCEYVFNKLNLDYRDYVVIDKEFSRPQETKHLKGDSSKLRTVVGWKPEYTYETLLDEMIDYYLQLNNN
jgi:GDPmannose 4,6-dehydratase